METSVAKTATSTISELENQLLYLTHVTSTSNFFKILESGKICSKVDMWYESVHSIGLSDDNWNPSQNISQYPGVYMSLINNKFVDKPIRLLEEISRPICLVFCISLLDRGDFHYNNVDSNGYITSNTSFNMSDLEAKKYDLDITNEVIFHQSVPLKYLKEIWFHNELAYDYVMSKIPDKIPVKITVKITQKYLNISPLTCDDPIIKLTPNYCYFSIPEEHIDFAKKLAINCNIYNDNEITEKINDIVKTETIEPIKRLRLNMLLKDNILKKYKTAEDINKYLKGHSLSDDIIEKLSGIDNMNLVGLNFLKKYSRIVDGEKNTKSKRKSRGKNTKRKSRRKQIKSRGKTLKVKGGNTKSKRKKSCR